MEEAAVLLMHGIRESAVFSACPAARPIVKANPVKSLFVNHAGQTHPDLLEIVRGDRCLDPKTRHIASGLVNRIFNQFDGFLR